MMEMRGEPMRIALAGNPNVGKSTLFNALTGLHQHTGNWPGKTVGKVTGDAMFQGNRITLIDLPGTYSLTGSSEDERIAAEYIASGEADCIIAVCDGSCLERTLILVLQVLQCTERVVVCVNLMDEAWHRGIQIDKDALEEALGVPADFQAPVVMPDLAHGVVYVKILNQQTGAADFLEYRRTEPQQAPNPVSLLEERVNRLESAVRGMMNKEAGNDV
jgi:GTPase Era involved in 16S rRNA processing